ncbi:hypothetical protein [Pelagicoccus sp. SDUM812005]|uniref:hypothetical protein n=1 Tax=Pelagicoccus sp. SDUM812005 TaxID=3041257 RepID=UPI00280D7C5A|nr:hypothetical protein [Pelagicoccus sp. SDUM812005]MDQ8181189.1 hypothetical protein [Pelagicoccus sp. SDUM812005]
MNLSSIIIGYATSTLGGALLLWLVIDKVLWKMMEKEGGGKKPLSFSLLLGILERASYTTALLMGHPAWIGVYLAMKVAVGWRAQQSRVSPSDNVYLIGNLLSIGMGLLGYWIATDLKTLAP